MMMEFLLQRLQERTTWLGLTAFATAGGINLAPEVANLVITTGYEHCRSDWRYYER